MLPTYCNEQPLDLPLELERGFLLLELQQLQAELPFPRQLGLLLLRLLQS